ncbi:NAD kinase [Candidatus Jidaibacter acanthamoebae]|nr:NAD kinase [Candidatus Jidaibacter acanthamoeba]
MSKYKRIGVMADLNSIVALNAYKEIMKKYDFIDAMSVSPQECDLVITIGGDGMMLKALHRYMDHSTPIYGMNRGSVGFLMNDYVFEDLLDHIDKAVETRLYPLEMRAETLEGEIHAALAVNEVSLLRETNQAAKIRIFVNDEVRLDCLVADGVLIATPAGSSAYNFAAYGPIIPLDANILALTPICPFRPRRWRGALLSHKSRVRLEVLEADKRPVSAVADSTEVRNVRSVEITERKDKVLKILFDKQNMFEERVMKEQFSSE